ncbi:hypothetical protein RHGRI_013143 [Rhododendron griersonianum]|uniref:Uncharacterized protein n=1 Tax=Rhododendron griersonianum TaxID=479676 RepID=A0AAV6K4H2_9ERIC|nr:hypothetical protein RHGRI_013143 [Rhododendron griersonianum]
MLHLSDSHHSPFAQGTSILLHEPLLDATEIKLMPPVELSKFLAVCIVLLAYDTNFLHRISRIQQLIAMPPTPATPSVGATYETTMISTMCIHIILRSSDTRG